MQTKKTLHAKGNEDRAKQKREIPANRGDLPGDLKDGTHPCYNSKGRKGWATESQFTNLGPSNTNDTKTDGEGVLSDGNDMANSYQESTSRDHSTGGYTIETVVSRRPRVEATDSGEINNEVREAYRPQLVDDRPRFQNVRDRPVFFPASPEWFHLGSHNAPLARDVRRLTPLVGWPKPPLGGPGDGSGNNETLRLPRDFVDQSTHLLSSNGDKERASGIPTKQSRTSLHHRGQPRPQLYKYNPRKQNIKTGVHILNQTRGEYESTRIPVTRSPGIHKSKEGPDVRNLIIAVVRRTHEMRS